MMQELGDRARVGFAVEFRSMHFGNQGDALVAAGAIDDHDPLGRAQREVAAEGGDARVRKDGAHVAAHEAADGERPDASNVVGAADGLAPKVQPPGRERVAEQLTHGDRGNDCGRENSERNRQIAGGFQRKERHRERPADDSHCHGGHADDGGDQGIG